MRTSILFLILFAIISCSKKEKPLDIFTIHEQNVYQKLVRKNDSMVLQLYKAQHKTLNKAYDSYLRSLDQNGLEAISKNHFFTDKKMIDDLCDSKILLKEEISLYKSDIKKENIRIRDSSNYMVFLEQIAQYNPVIKRYLTDYRFSGDLSPVSTKILVSQLTPEDLNDKNIRLIVGIHFLIINANMRN